MPLPLLTSSGLSEPQRRMYASETTENFRWVAKFGQPSSYTLTPTDLCDADLQAELADIGQFAEVAHGKLSPTFIWSNLEHLSQTDFPLNEYHALSGSLLISAFRGTVAELQGYIAYRPQTNQLVIAFSGTSSVSQTSRNIDVRFNHPRGNRCGVHSGFWKLYQGVRSQALEGLTRGLASHSVDEVVLTGHSLGSAMCYLLALDIMGGDEWKPGSESITKLPLKLVVFGSPRVGNSALVQQWRTIVADRISRGFRVIEYSVRGYNDGVPSIPPYNLGYRHLAETPLYFAQGSLYRIPAAEAEYSIFNISSDDKSSKERFSDHPLGGHNYYNNRDMEKLLRRMKWFSSVQPGKVDWQAYREWLRKECEREGT